MNGMLPEGTTGVHWGDRLPVAFILDATSAAAEGSLSPVGTGGPLGSCMKDKGQEAHNSGEAEGLAP